MSTFQLGLGIVVLLSRLLIALLWTTLFRTIPRREGRLSHKNPGRFTSSAKLGAALQIRSMLDPVRLSADFPAGRSACGSRQAQGLRPFTDSAPWLM